MGVETGEKGRGCTKEQKAEECVRSVVCSDEIYIENPTLSTYSR